MKYLYFIPLGGFNDILCRIQEYYDFCKKTKRKLYIDTYYSPYKTNMFDHIKIDKNKVIDLNFNNFLNFIKDDISIFPNINKENLSKIIYHKTQIKNIINQETYIFKDFKHILFTKPKFDNNESLIIYARYGGGDSFQTFNKHIFFRKNIRDYCIYMLNKIKKPYIGIQIRNTDLKTEYKHILEKYKKLFISYDRFYIATDDVNVLNYFKFKNINVYNFCTFPKKKSINLHSSNVNNDIKIRDLICDLFLLLNSQKIIIESRSGFSNLIKKCFKNKKEILKKIIK